MIAALLFPDFDPVALQIGPLAIRWYALAYIVGILLSWRLLRRLVIRSPEVATTVQADDFVSWATLGVVLGGRLGYCLLYEPRQTFTDPTYFFTVWKGGMASHGGILGVILVMIFYARAKKIPFYNLADATAFCVPLQTNRVLPRLSNAKALG